MNGELVSVPPLPRSQVYWATWDTADRRQRLTDRSPSLAVAYQKINLK